MVSRLENEAVLDRMDARMVRHPDILQRRREIVEHPFGSIKQWMNQGAFLMRRLRALVREWTKIQSFALVRPVTSSERRLAYPDLSFD